MKIDIKCKNPTYTLELSQEEFLVLFEAIGDRTNDVWEEYGAEYRLTKEQTKHLQNVSYNVYDKMNKTIKEVANPHNGEVYMSEKWLAEQYKESYKD